MPVMRLDEYLNQKKGEGLTEEAFASRVGLSQGQVNRLRRGASRPSFNTLVRIRDATEGQVTPDDFIGPEPAE